MTGSTGSGCVSGSSETEASSSQGTLGPSVLNVGKVPVNNLGGSILVKLVANINQTLDRCNIDVVNGGEVKHNSFEDGSLVISAVLDVSGFVVIPGSITKLAKKRGISPAALFENRLGEVVEISGGIGVVESLGKSVDEDTGVRASYENLGVGAIAVVQGQEATSEGATRILNRGLLDV